MHGLHQHVLGMMLSSVRSTHSTSIKNIFNVGMAMPKLQKLDVGMAVCRQDMLYKDHTSNPSLHPFYTCNSVSYATRLLGRAIFEPKKM